MPVEQIDLGGARAQDRRIHRAQSVAARAGAGARRRHGDHRVDRDLPLYSRGCVRSRRCSAAARSKRRWSRCGTGASSSIFIRRCRPSSAIPHPAMKDMECRRCPNGARRTGRACSNFLRLLDRELKDRLFVAGDHYTRRRHHGAGRGRFHAAREADHAGGARQSAPLACAGRRAAERDGLTCA